MATTGGAKTKAFIIRAKAARATGIDNVQIGFWSSARYADGTPVTNVAAQNEFGSKSGKIPSRPFMRTAAKDVEPRLRRLIATRLDPKTMVADEFLTNDIGETVAAEIRDQITRWSTPPNSPRTIEIKGSSNPLVDTSFMRRSVTHKIRR